uniref:Uncharacterized protein n=1 Tax=Tanacetum cinerariifolium TaxID=118510 RepID=A0A6L2LQL7_TANCI|nr:hypothetical protein [Tanacetum cinerariifolium]
MGVLKDVPCQVGVTTIIAKFLILDMPIDRDAPILTFRAVKTSLNTKESDSDDEEDYGIQRNIFGAPMYGPKRAKYLNCNDPMNRALALQDVKNPFKKNMFGRKLTLDSNIVRELVDSNGRLIPKGIAHSIPRVPTPRTPRPTTSDLYDKISQFETRVGEIKRMTRRQSYHSDIYARVL